jgi:hypothetical protein
LMKSMWGSNARLGLLCGFRIPTFLPSSSRTILMGSSRSERIAAVGRKSVQAAS